MKTETQKGMTPTGEKVDVEIPDVGRPGCANCAFAIISVDGATNKPEGFECRRYAPQPGVIAAWPTVRPDDWCGQYMGRKEFYENERTRREAAGMLEMFRDVFNVGQGGPGSGSGGGPENLNG